MEDNQLHFPFLCFFFQRVQKEKKKSNVHSFPPPLEVPNGIPNLKKSKGK